MPCLPFTNTNCLTNLEQNHTMVANHEWNIGFDGKADSLETYQPSCSIPLIIVSAVEAPTKDVPTPTI